MSFNGKKSRYSLNMVLLATLACLVNLFRSGQGAVIQKGMICHFLKEHLVAYFLTYIEKDAKAE